MEKVETELEELGVSYYFSFVIGVSPTGQTKPHFSIFNAAANAINVSIDRLLHVGNNFYADYRGALDADAQALLLDRWNFFADVPGRIESMDQILRLFKQIR